MSELFEKSMLFAYAQSLQGLFKKVRNHLVLTFE